VNKIRKHTATSTQPTSKSAVSPLMIGIVTAIAILVVGSLIVLGNFNNRPTRAVDLNQFPALGPANAPITMVEYSDYRCPHCRDFKIETFPKIEEEYINTGKVRFVVSPFHLWPETAVLTEAALCAADQKKFFEYSYKLFENQETMGLSQSSLADLAASISLSRETFGQCLSKGTHRASLEDATHAALNRGISSTPTFFINNQRVEGNQPYEEFKRIIEQELAKAQ
jgi:protein-disulfide isomerase